MPLEDAITVEGPGGATVCHSREDITVADTGGATVYHSREVIITVLHHNNQSAQADCDSPTAV